MAGGWTAHRDSATLPLLVLPACSPERAAYTSEQLMILTDDGAGFRLIRGAAGSRKTTAALMRIRQLCSARLARVESSWRTAEDRLSTNVSCKYLQRVDVQWDETVDKIYGILAVLTLDVPVYHAPEVFA